jgi:restriction endonuclease S subunit
VRLRFVASLGPPVEGFAPCNQGDVVSFLSLDKIWSDDRFNPHETVEFSGDLQSYNPVMEGDLLVPKVSPTFTHGRTAVAVGLVNGRALATSEVFVLRAHDRRDSKFLQYRLLSPDFLAAGEAAWQGVAGLKRVTADFVKSVEIGHEAWERRYAIADFLDVELARIRRAVRRASEIADRLASARERVMDNLLFGHAESAVDSWYGELPEGWGVAPLKSLATGYPPMFTDGDWIESPFIVDSGIRLIQTGNVARGRFVDQGFRFITEETFGALQCTEVLPGDVLLSRLSPPVGRACLCPDLGTRMISSVDVTILRPRLDVNPLWIVAACSSDRYLAWLDLESRGATMQRVSRSQLGNVRVPVPPRDHQHLVAATWSRETEAEQRARNVAERVVHALTAYRDTLIYEAVTGKLDVTRTSEWQMDERILAAAENRQGEAAV